MNKATKDNLKKDGFRVGDAKDFVEEVLSQELPCPRPICQGEARMVQSGNDFMIQCVKCEYHSRKCGSEEEARRSWENSSQRKEKP
jgi:hypothetical protein